MDELDKLKKDWQKKEPAYPKFSYNEIYKMILKKSSSIVKWIFIISILEFAFWLFLAIGLKASGYNNDYGGLYTSPGFIIITAISYGILAYFFYRFYMNYKRINTTDNAKTLMENILKTRRTVKQYVGFNLAFLVIGVTYMMPFALSHDEQTKAVIDAAKANGEIFKYYLGVIVATVIILAIAIAFLLLFYWLIYGLLLRSLNRNYKELKKLEV